MQTLWLSPLGGAVILLPILASCASHPPVTRATPSSSAEETVYASPDRLHTIIFARDGARFGPLLDYRPERPPAATRYLELNDGVRCVSIGIPGNTTEYAIKRPIRAGERYRCGRTSFRVARCVSDCATAVIEYDTRFAENLGAPEGYLYVNDCRGILAFSSRGDFAEGTPVNAEVLRGNVGILADPNNPGCGSS